MSASQRRKGATILTEQLGWVVKRELGQPRDSGADLHICQFRFEVKRRRGVAVHEWVDQAARACGPGNIPVVACRGDGKEWLVVMRLEDALPLLRNELPQR